jgi:hypothetical protein
MTTAGTLSFMLLNKLFREVLQMSSKCPASYLNFLGFAYPTGIASAALSLWQEGRNLGRTVDAACAETR